jgi:hypothetical protein
VATAADDIARAYDDLVPPSWRISLVILVACLLASMAIALVKLL